MAIERFSEFVAYFREIAQDHVGIEYFGHGAGERILELSRSEISYPVFWLETPMTKWKMDNGTLTRKRVAAFVVAHKAQTDSHEDQDAQLNLCDELTADFLTRLHRDQQKRGFRIDWNAIVSESIPPMLVDNLVGWRTEFDFADSASLCWNFAKWKSSPK